MRIYPMPKIKAVDFDEIYCLNKQFKYFEDIKSIRIMFADESEPEYLQCDDIVYMKNIVVGYIRSWIKQNFEPIILPDLKAIPSQFGVYDFNVVEDEGYNKSIKELLDLNKNIIKVEE